jgi:putative ABC transport system permease protein
LFVPLGQEYQPEVTLHVRGAGDPALLLAAVRAEVAALAPALPLLNPTTLREQIGVAVLPQRIAAVLLAVFGGLAVVLATLGLYGVTSYAVAQRTREFGIRSALGARRADVTTLVMQDGLFLTSVGVGVGLPLAVALTSLASRFLFGVSPLDPITLGAVALLLVAATLGASLIPARRAAGVHPMEALRHE